MDENASVLPSFALSYPATVSVCAGVMTSTLLLIVHLGFSAQYHCPLCKMNYLLQASSTLAMLLRFTTELGIVLHDMREFAQMWPYMFPYLTYRLPHRSTWSTAQIFFWVLLKSINSLLAHGTSIQMLTLLFPSRIERHLLYWLLVPLALVHAGMSFSDFAPAQDYKTEDLTDAITNICASSLALMGLAGMLIWSTLINWRRAWRFDGSTAVFGILSIFTALAHTTSSFVHIGYDRIYWLRDVSLVMCNWQNWLMFWWWVSSGMGIGEYEDQLRIEERKRLRDRRNSRRKQSVTSTGRRASAARASAEGAATIPLDDLRIEPASQGSDPSESQYTSATSAPERTPWLVRMLGAAGAHMPRLVRTRVERLKIAHREALNHVAPAQAARYVRVMRHWPTTLKRSEVMKKVRLQDKTVYT